MMTGSRPRPTGAGRGDGGERGVSQVTCADFLLPSGALTERLTERRGGGGHLLRVVSILKRQTGVSHFYVHSACEMRCRAGAEPPGPLRRSV